MLRASLVVVARSLSIVILNQLKIVFLDIFDSCGDSNFLFHLNRKLRCDFSRKFSVDYESDENE